MAESRAPFWGNGVVSGGATCGPRGRMSPAPVAALAWLLCARFARAGNSKDKARRVRNVASPCGTQMRPLQRGPNVT